MSSLPWKDVLADGNGFYRDQGMFYWNFDQEYRCIRSKYHGKIPRKDLAKDTFVVAKYYYKHKLHRDFHQFACYVISSRHDFFNNFVLVGYTFDGPDHPISTRPAWK